jgi:hypothetical protein
MSYKPLNTYDALMPIDFERNVAKFVDKRVQFQLAGDWDVTLQGTVDGSNWVAIEENVVSGATIVEVPEFWFKLRVIENTGGDAGDYQVTLGGLQILD